MSKIICVGSASKDIFFPTAEGVVTETPDDLMCQKKIAFELGAKYKIDERHEALGGVAANVASGLARLGLEVSCYSYIGDDYISQWIADQLKNNGVETDLIVNVKDCLSDLSAIVVDKNSGERVIFTNQPANKNLEVVPEKLEKAEWIFLGDLHGDWEKHLEKIFSLAKENNIKIANNPRQINIHENAKKVLEFISKSDLIVLNKDESIEVLSAGEEKFSSDELNSEEFLVKKLHSLGPKIVAVTDGMRGSWATDGEKVIHAPAIGVKAVETTGAGDAYSSGFFAAYLKGKDLEECLKWGVANSGSSVQFFGAIEGLLKESEIVKMADEVEIEEIK